MVAPVDVFIFLPSGAAFDPIAQQLQLKSSSGGGRVETARFTGRVSEAVDRTYLEEGRAPVGVIVSSEAEVLEAIEAGADDALVLSQEVESSVLTAFLARIRLRASIRSERERLTHDLAQAEKLTALGTLVAGVGHELNNPLSAITLSFDILREMMAPDLVAVDALREKIQARNEEDPELVALLGRVGKTLTGAATLLRDISSATEAVTLLVQDLRVFSRSSQAEPPTLFSPRSLIAQALRLVRREFGPNTVIEEDYDEDLPELRLPRNRLAQVITNLLVNAAHAMNDVERDVHRVRISARRDDQYLALSISDSGPGIPDDALEKIFNPFYTTKRESQGTGLGLSISRSILQHMGGELAVTSLYGEGATFLCILPLPTAEEVASAKRVKHLRPEPPRSAKKLSVLVVDDDHRALRSVARTLQESFKVLIAQDGQEAVELLASGSPVDIVLTELELPELDGPGLLAWISDHRSDLLGRVIFATGAQERAKYQDFLAGVRNPVVHKPLHRTPLLALIREVCGGGSDAYLHPVDG